MSIYLLITDETNKWFPQLNIHKKTRNERVPGLRKIGREIKHFRDAFEADALPSTYHETKPHYIFPEDICIYSSSSSRF